MRAWRLKRLLKKTDNKLDVFSRFETLKCDVSISELLNIIRENLKNEQIVQLFKFPYFKNMNNIFKFKILDLIKEESVKAYILKNSDFVEGLKDYEIMSFVKSFNENTLGNILNDKDLILNKLNLSEAHISSLAETLQDDDIKLKIIQVYQLKKHDFTNIVSTLSNASKLELVRNGENLYRRDKMNILKLLDVEALHTIIANDKDLLKENNISVYEITVLLESEKQIEFVAGIEDMNLTQIEKREILATLHVDAKQAIDTTNLPEEYITALTFNVEEMNQHPELYFEDGLQDYSGLDHLIRINPEFFIEEQKANFIKLCDKYPNLSVISTIDDFEFASTTKEYKYGEEWISSLIGSLKPEYTIIQKLAVIDNAIGKKISYSPDQGTEVFSEENSRALWKIISLGYGVCNGISKVEKYILDRVGIESEIVNSSNHTFLKLKDIEFTRENGETSKGNTILDSTWNLTANKFGGKPKAFCINYEQARINDIDEKGVDHGCHKNDSQLQDATLNLDEMSLIQLYTSIGLANENGEFPIKNLFERSITIDEIFEKKPDQNILMQLLLLTKTYPEFATCQNSSIEILDSIFSNAQNLEFNNCSINKVYDITDEEKIPIVYVYIDTNELGGKFYFASKTEGRFVELSQEEFTKRFECYEKDLNKYNGLRPWENRQSQEEEIISTRSSSQEFIKESI